MVEEKKQQILKHRSPTLINLWFIRHGESVGNTLGNQTLVRHNTPLTAQGQKEARAAADYFIKNNIKVSHIFSSPSGRTYETALIISKELGLPVVAEEGLNERNWGDWNSLSWQVVSDKLASLNIEERYNFIPDNGESWKQMEDRLIGCLEDIAAKTKNGEDVLLITHRGCLRALLPVLAKVTKDKHEDYSVQLGSLSRFSLERDELDLIGHIPQ
jgi:broad specificity phosphatase PhoE